MDEKTLADAAQLASLADETPEGRSIVILAKQRFNLRERDVQSLHATFVPFTAQSRMSGINIDNRMIRKGSVDAIRRHVEANGGHFPADVDQKVDQVARQGATPLVVVEGSHVLGVIALKDIVKGGIKERFAQLRKMGIKTVMITGDNRLTAAAIAAEAGVDDFLAEATPEAKLALIRQYQAEGRLVAMTGDGTNDAPALAQADVAVAMNSGTRGERSGQYGGSRLQPDQVDRGSAHWQTDADDPWLVDHLQHCQRCGEILRHYSSGIRGNVSAVKCAEHHAPAFARLRHSQCGHFQRLDYRLFDSPGVKRREL
ncbi:hypothetical protein ECZU51_11240 [Escherichia coli]|nr:hypothetical protein ECZU51_11240 [Escherichia coli]